jgi:glycosyltransferase involved in cell wall biosynthesis
MAATLVRGLNRSGTVEASLIHGENTIRVMPFIGIQGRLERYLNAGLYRLLGASRYGIYRKQALRQAVAGADLIHLHNLHGYWLDYAKLMRQLDKPVVWTWHDMWPITGRCGFSLGCELWRQGCLSCPHKAYYPTTYRGNSHVEFHLKSDFFRRATQMRVVTPSDWLAKLAVERGISHDRVSVISNPVDTERFRAMDRAACRERLGLPPTGDLLLFVANRCNDPRKGYEEFETIVSHTNASGLVVGEPPRQQHERITYLGQVRDQDLLVRCYGAADAMLIPSKEDNYPNTVLESMACARPVFGFGVGGIPSQLPVQWSGLVASGEVELLAQRVEAYLALPAVEREQIGVDMRGFVECRSSIESVAGAYATIYAQLIKGGT